MTRKQVKKGKIPTFIKKIISFLENLQFKEVVTWLPHINGFQILNVNKFSSDVLSLYFKHQNLSSFVRQLNMYGFTRPKELDQYIYCHPRFQRGNNNSLRFIQRKSAPATRKQNEDETSADKLQTEPKQKHSRLSLMLTKLINQNQQLKIKNKYLNQQLHLILTHENYQLSYDPNALLHFSQNHFIINHLTNFHLMPNIQLQQHISTKCQNQLIINNYNIKPSLETTNSINFGLFMPPSPMQATYREIYPS